MAAREYIFSYFLDYTYKLSFQRNKRNKWTVKVNKANWTTSFCSGVLHESGPISIATDPSIHLKNNNNTDVSV